MAAHPDPHHVRTICTLLDKGRTEWSIVEELVKLEGLERSEVQDWVSRVAVIYRRQRRASRRWKLFGLALFLVSMVPPYLGYPMKGTQPPLWEGFLGIENPKTYLYFLIPAMVGVFIYLNASMTRTYAERATGSPVPWRLGLFRTRNPFSDL